MNVPVTDQQMANVLRSAEDQWWWYTEWSEVVHRLQSLSLNFFSLCSSCSLSMSLGRNTFGLMWGLVFSDVVDAFLAFMWSLCLLMDPLFLLLVDPMLLLLGGFLLVLLVGFLLLLGVLLLEPLGGFVLEVLGGFLLEVVVLEGEWLEPSADLMDLGGTGGCASFLGFLGGIFGLVLQIGKLDQLTLY